ncbi:MAG: hypothetical protein ACFFEV_00290 [Candidatus Thorarchaeota archaeon]
MSLKDKISDAIDRGKKIGEDSDTFDFRWYKFFDFTENPFYLRPSTLEDVSRDLFIDRLTELEALGEMIGLANSSKSGVFKLAVIGADGVGKRSLARILSSLSKEKQIPGIIFDVKNDYDIQGPSIDGLSYIILENCSNFKMTKVVIDEIQRKSESAILVIVLLAPEHHVALLEMNPELFDREIRMKPLQNQQCIDIIESRLLSFRKSSDEVISTDALTEITNYSQGLPKFAIEFLRDSFRIAFEKRKKLVESTEVSEALRRYKRLNLIEFKLTTREHDILNVMLRLRTSDANAVGDDLGVSHNVSWKYLDGLEKKGILEKTYEGKRTYYSINSFIAAQLQLHLYEGVINGI